ncbi:MAG: hypothetical protein ABSA97_09535 [Verrucomicrobiia bacterium]
MTPLNFTVTKEDFDAYQWQDVILKASQQECDLYVDHFYHQAEECGKANDERGKQIYTLLGAIASLAPKFDSPDDPFGPMWQSPNGRSPILDDFTENHLEVFRQLAPSTKDPALRGRFADVLWVKKRDHEMARLAVDAYIELGATIKKLREWVRCTNAIDRALQIAAQLGRNNEPFKKVIVLIENLLAKYQDYGTKFLTARLMELLLDHTSGTQACFSVRSIWWSTTGNSSSLK